METLRTERVDGVQIVTLDRGKANPINHRMLQEFRALIRESNADPEVRGSVLTGKPGYFSAGLDVIELYSYDETKMVEFWRDLAGILVDLSASPKPWVAAISGHSPAGGCVLAICCDQRVMAEGNYRIGLNEVPVGIVVPSPIYHLYAAILGSRVAYQFLMEGRLLLPQDALNAGLVDAVVAPDQVMDEAMRRLQGYLALNQTVWRQTKQLLREPLIAAMTPDFETAYGPTLAQWWSEDSRSQIAAMIQKLKNK